MDVVCIAGFQSGKTAIESHWLLREIQRCAPLILFLGFGTPIYIGPTLELLRQQAIPSFRRLFVAEHKLGRLIEGGKPRFEFSDEGARRLVGFDDCSIIIPFAYANDSSNLESITGLCAVWDEAGQKENKADSLEACDRRLALARSKTFGQMADWIKADPDRLRKLQWWLDTYYAEEGPDARFGRRFWGSTPYEWNFFKTDVHDRALADAGYELINFAHWMNPNNSKERAMEARKHMEDWRWQMMYLGLFTKPAGVIYDCFGPENICPAFDIPKAWRRYAGIDFGNINCAALKIAEEREELPRYPYWGKPTGRYFVYWEYHGSDRPLNPEEDEDSTEPTPEQQHVERILEGEPVINGALQVPHAIGGAKAERGWRVAFGRYGLPVSEPKEKDVEKGIAKVLAGFKTDNLLVFETCKRTIGQLETYSRELDENNQPIQGTIKDKEKYHFLDALRYAANAFNYEPKDFRPSRSAYDLSTDDSAYSF